MQPRIVDTIEEQPHREEGDKELARLGPANAPTSFDRQMAKTNSAGCYSGRTTRGIEEQLYRLFNLIPGDSLFHRPGYRPGGIV